MAHYIQRQFSLRFHASVKHWANQPTNQFNNMRYLVFVLHSSGWADMPASPWTGRISHVHSVIFGWCVGAGAYQHLKLITNSHVAPGGFE
jgi:hypothetical protein